METVSSDEFPRQLTLSLATALALLSACGGPNGDNSESSVDESNVVQSCKAFPEPSPEALRPTLVHWVADQAHDVGPSRGWKGIARMVGDAKVLGLGEPGHGWHEFPTLRNELFRYVVEEHGYRAITLESGVVEGRIADLYVRDVSDKLHMTEDAVLRAGFTHGMGPWKETRELVAWVRQHNKDASAAGRPLVHLVGKDLPTEGDSVTVPLAPALTFMALLPGGDSEKWSELSALAMKSTSVTDTILDALASVGLPRVIDPDFLDAITSVSYELLSATERANLRSGVLDLRPYLEAHRAEYLELGEEDGYDWALHLVDVSLQLIEDLDRRIDYPGDPQMAAAYELMKKVYEGLKKPLPPVNPKKFVNDQKGGQEYLTGRESRERHLAENVVWMSERYGKTLDFAANSHLEAFTPVATVPGFGELQSNAEGRYLREHFGDAYRVIATLNDRFVDAQGEPLKVHHGAPLEPTEACVDCLEGLFVETKLDRILLDMRDGKRGCSIPAWIGGWLGQEHSYRHDTYFVTSVPSAQWDALLWLQSASPAVPLEAE